MLLKQLKTTETTGWFKKCICQKDGEDRNTSSVKTDFRARRKTTQCPTWASNDLVLHRHQRLCRRHSLLLTVSWPFHMWKRQWIKSNTTKRISIQPGGHKQGLQTTLITMLEFFMRLWNSSSLFLLVQEKQIFSIQFFCDSKKSWMENSMVSLSFVLTHLSGKNQWAWKQVTSVHILWGFKAHLSAKSAWSNFSSCWILHDILTVKMQSQNAVSGFP